MYANASVARARKTPESRIAVSATRAPTTAVTTHAPRMARIHGKLWSADRWAKVVAPMAASPRWQRETWPDVRTNIPSDRKRTTYTRHVV